MKTMALRTVVSILEIRTKNIIPIYFLAAIIITFFNFGVSNYGIVLRFIDSIF